MIKKNNKKDKTNLMKMKNNMKKMAIQKTNTAKAKKTKNKK